MSEAMSVMTYVIEITRLASKMPIKHEAKLSALFYVYQELGHALTVLKK